MGIGDAPIRLDDDSDSEIELQQQLMDAQLQWEQSLEQLGKVLNWIILPLVGRLLGRKVALVIWKRCAALWAS